jgi:hypothetical protein
VAVSYIMNEYPDRDWKELPKYDLLTLEAWLNKCGEEGWELVKLEAVDAIGKNGDVGMVYLDAYPAYRHRYLCVFKRPAAGL